MQRVSSMSAFGRGRSARPPGMRVGSLDAQVRAALFGQGQGGYMLSFDRVEALYQDSTGVVSGGSAGNPLGLVLDQRYGLTRGPQLVRNADFTTDISVWSTVNAARVWDNGRAFVTTSAANGRMEQGILGGLVPGRLYEVVGNVELGTATDVTIRTIRDAAGSYANIASSRQTAKSGPLDFRFTFLAPAADCIIQAATNDAAGTFWVDYIYIRDVAGNHFQQATTTARPLRQQDAYGWYADADGTDDFLQSLGSIDYSAFDRLTTFTGVQRLSNPITAIIREISVNRDTNVGTHALMISPDSGRNRYRSLVNFGNVAEATVTDATRLIGGRDVVVTTAVVGDLATVRLNKDQSAVAPGGGGSSPFGSYAHFLFRRGNTTANYFTGRIYAHVEVASNAPLTAQQIALGEAWIRSKMAA